MFKDYYHNSWILKIRTLSRKTGILKVVKPLLSSRSKSKSYEEGFHEALKNVVSTGDTVWDVGANVGVYTSHFLDWVGPTGKVVSFEPLPKAFDALTNTIMAHPYKNRAILECTALSDYSGETTFLNEGPTGMSRTGYLAAVSEQGSGITVKVETADLIVSRRGLAVPNIVKIDVEGFEEDVLRGGENTFKNADCRHLLIEVHFGRIDERNIGNSVSRIVKMLKMWGYKIKWVDESHLHASK